MIVDTLDNLGFYQRLNPLFSEVINFLATHDLNTLEDGKYPIKGDYLFLNITTVQGKTREEAVMETHDKMLDIQIPLSAAESYGYTPRTQLPAADYNEANDITKIPGVMGLSYVTCLPGMFAIFFPQDGHAPCVSPSPVRKAIFKVRA